MCYKPPKPFAWNYCGACGKQLKEAFDGERDMPYCSECQRFYYRNPVPATCCFVRHTDGALLFARRAVEPCRGQWGLPGGFMELGETSEEAALRELAEETSLQAKDVQLLGISTQQNTLQGAVMVIGYVIDEWEGSPTAASDALELQFFTRDTRPPLAFAVHRDLLALYDAQYPE